MQNNTKIDNKTELLGHEYMTSRQRVLNAINHLPVDRMPIDLGMHYSTGISAFAYWNLREYLGLPTDNIEIVDMVQFLARVDKDILEKFHCDCMLLQPSWSGTHIWNPRDKYNFKIPVTAKPQLNIAGDWQVKHKGKMRMPKNGFFFDGDWLGFEERDEDEVIRLYSIEAERIFKETNYFTSFISLSGFFKEADIEWHCKMITDPKEIIEENKQLLKSEIKRAGKIINSMGGYIQGICLGGDLGSQSGPLVRPSIYQELCAPFLKELCSFIHRNSDLKIFMHSCGSIKQFIPMLIDSGVDVLNPVQISANNMDPRDLKKEFGNKITFWGGGCDTQRVLNVSNPEGVAENVKELVKIFKPESGFVFNQVHNIMGDIKPENIISMLETAYKESFY
jgi:uroporphyrinogen decarboxylase